MMQRIFSSFALSGFAALLASGLLLFASPLGAQERPPGAPADPGASAAPGKNEADRAAQKRADMQGINDSWMRKIHGQGAADAGNPADGASTKPVGEKPRRFPNPSAPAAGDSEGANDANNAGDARGRATPELFANQEEGPSFFSIIFRFLGLAALMILVLYAGLRLIRNRAGPLLGASELVQVIATIPLMQGRYLQIVDMAGQLLVLGVSDSGVNLVAEIDDARVGDRIRLWQSERANLPTPAGMLEQLTGILKKTDFSFWHSEKTERGGPDFKEWLGRYAPASPGSTATPAPAVATEPAPGTGLRLDDIPDDADQESLTRLLKTQRQKLQQRSRGGL